MTLFPRYQLSFIVFKKGEKIEQIQSADPAGLEVSPDIRGTAAKVELMHLLSSELGSKSQFPLKIQPNQQQPNSELVVNVDYVTPTIIFHRSTRP